MVDHDRCLDLWWEYDVRVLLLDQFRLDLESARLLHDSDSNIDSKRCFLGSSPSLLDVVNRGPRWGCDRSGYSAALVSYTFRTNAGAFYYCVRVFRIAQ